MVQFRIQLEGFLIKTAVHHALFKHCIIPAPQIGNKLIYLHTGYHNGMKFMNCGLACTSFLTVASRTALNTFVCQKQKVECYRCSKTSLPFVIEQYKNCWVKGIQVPKVADGVFASYRFHYSIASLQNCLKCFPYVCHVTRDKHRYAKKELRSQLNKGAHI